MNSTEDTVGMDLLRLSLAFRRWPEVVRVERAATLCLHLRPRPRPKG